MLIAPREASLFVAKHGRWLLPQGNFHFLHLRTASSSTPPPSSSAASAYTYTYPSLSSPPCDPAGKPVLSSVAGRRRRRSQRRCCYHGHLTVPTPPTPLRRLCEPPRSPLTLPMDQPQSSATTLEMRKVSQTSSNGNSPLRMSPSHSALNGSSSANGFCGPILTEKKKPFLIGVAGGTASGKSTVCDRIMDAVGHHNNGTARQIVAVSQDSFYRDLTPTESADAQKGIFNFDHPDAFDHKLMLSCLHDIQEGKPTKIPNYDFKKNARKKDEFTVVYPSDVVLLEGILVFYSRDVREMFDMKLFVDTDADTRLARRVLRDIDQRGRDLEHVLLQYTNLVKPAFEEFCLPTKKFADVIIPRGADNTVAIDLIVQHLQSVAFSSSPHAQRRRYNPGEQRPGGRQRSISEYHRRPH